MPFEEFVNAKFWVSQTERAFEDSLNGCTLNKKFRLKKVFSSRIFFVIFTKGNDLYDFLFASLDDVAVSESGQNVQPVTDLATA